VLPLLESGGEPFGYAQDRPPQSKGGKATTDLSAEGSAKVDCTDFTDYERGTGG